MFSLPWEGKKPVFTPDMKQVLLKTFWLCIRCEWLGGTAKRQNVTVLKEKKLLFSVNAVISDILLNF